MTPIARMAAREEWMARGDPRFPRLLKEIPRPPAKLWWEGDPSILSLTTVSIVGSRRASDMGLRMARKLAGGLAAEGLVIVSGCAYGIDAAAHRAALEVGGLTVAVLAGGIDVSVVRGNRPLSRRIVEEGGCLVSEHPAGVEPQAWSFPRRNRIVAGLSRVVIVVEAAGKSGTESTVDHALDAGREVMVVPGSPLIPTTEGLTRLLAQGATPVHSVDDVLDVLGGLWPLDEEAAKPPPPPRPRAGLEGLAGRLLDALTELPQPLEALAERVDAPTAGLLAALTRLEILGFAEGHPGQRYSRAIRSGR